MAKKSFKIGDVVMVSVPTLNAIEYVGVGKITKVRESKTMFNEYQVKGDWYAENCLTIKKISEFAPTQPQMAIIKETYPILKQGDVKVLYEGGSKFLIRFNKGKEIGYRFYNGKEFSKMEEKEIERYVYSN